MTKLSREQLVDQIEWYIAFAEYVRAVNLDLFEDACEYSQMLKEPYEK